MAHHARFELMRDEDDGRLYWWGAEDGWKDPTEVGKDGVLIISAEHFRVGSILTLSEPTGCLYCANGDEPDGGMHYFTSPSGHNTQGYPCENAGDDFDEDTAEWDDMPNVWGEAGPFASLRDMTYTACPCGCGSKEVCEAHAARVKANDDAIPF